MELVVLDLRVWWRDWHPQLVIAKNGGFEGEKIPEVELFFCCLAQMGVDDDIGGGGGVVVEGFQFSPSEIVGIDQVLEIAVVSPVHGPLRQHRFIFGRNDNANVPLRGCDLSLSGPFEHRRRWGQDWGHGKTNQ